MEMRRLRADVYACARKDGDNKEKRYKIRAGLRRECSGSRPFSPVVGRCDQVADTFNDTHNRGVQMPKRTLSRLIFREQALHFDLSEGVL